MKKIIIWVIFIGILAAVGIYYYAFHYAAKHDDPLESEDVVEISAEKLFMDYSRDEEAANKMYLGKTIRINGIVKDIEFEDNRYTLVFNTNDSNGSVICEMDTVENRNLRNLAPHAPVSVAGFCNGLLIDVQLDRGRLAK